MSSAASPIAVPGRRPRRIQPTRQVQDAQAGAGARPLVRLASFSALSLYGVDRWARMLHPVPGWRLLGVAALAIALAGAVPPLRRATAGLPAVLGRPPAALLCAVLVLAAFPICGVRWHTVVHVRIAIAARHIGHGLGLLANIPVPYSGPSSAVVLVILLGAAVLLLDAAAVLAFAPPHIGDGRRTVAALPLIALAVVPSTLVRPTDPYLQGLFLFALLALFVWGERVSRDGASTALALAAVVGVGGWVIAPHLDRGRPWLNYEHWAGTATPRHVASFDWTQGYGPLHWPHSGEQVLTVRATTGDYWKAEDLDYFDGRDWISGEPLLSANARPSLPTPAANARKLYTHTDQVTIQGLSTTDVIGPGATISVRGIPGGTHPGAAAGTLEANQPLGPGSTYTITTYSPTPSPAQLAAATAGRYPWTALAGYLTLALPSQGARARSAGGRGPALTTTPQFTFAPFHSGGDPVQAVDDDPPPRGLTRLPSSSPYSRAFTLAQTLSARSANEYQFVRAVMSYLSTRNHFSYDQQPPVSRYPLEGFLFSSKLGYCQQFSGAMALLLRMGGVPARIGAGFTSGALNRESHTWQVADTDAHAWDEVWFPRYGWVRFDPTPASAPARGGSGAAAASALKRFPNALPKAGTRARPFGPTVDRAGGARAHAAGGGAGLSPWLIVAGVIALALAGVAARALWVITRPAGSCEDLVAELERALAATGRPLRAGVTLAALEDRYRTTPQAAAYVHALRLGRYGGAFAAPDRAQRRAMRHELEAGLGLTGRLRALLALPPRLRASRRIPDRPG